MQKQPHLSLSTQNAATLTRYPHWDIVGVPLLHGIIPILILLRFHAVFAVAIHLWMRPSIRLGRPGGSSILLLASSPESRHLQTSTTPCTRVEITLEINPDTPS